MNLNISKTKIDVAKQFAEFLMNFAQGKSKVTVALSGGSTPKIVFDYLAEHYSDSDWNRFHFYWGDERCVPPTDDESNYKMTLTHLFSKLDIPEGNIHRIKGENKPAYEADRYASLLASQLSTVNGIPQFDLVILGMGDDGHTASIFPHEITLWDATDWCVVATHPESGQKRVSLTGSVINNAKSVAFLVTGEGKAPKLKCIIGKEAGYKQYPASLVAPTSGVLHWFMDESAAAQLD